MPWHSCLFALQDKPWNAFSLLKRQCKLPLFKRWSLQSCIFALLTLSMGSGERKRTIRRRRLLLPYKSRYFRAPPTPSLLIPPPPPLSPKAPSLEAPASYHANVKIFGMKLVSGVLKTEALSEHILALLRRWSIGAWNLGFPVVCRGVEKNCCDSHMQTAPSYSWQRHWF